MKRAVANADRREFLKMGGSVAGGLALGFCLPGTVGAAARDTTIKVNAWIRIAPDDAVTILCARSEMGQGVYTSMTMLVAEELEVDPGKVKVEFAPVGQVYNNALLGGQLTGGSTSVRDAWEKLRKAGATARMMLVSAAAKKWDVDPDDCKASDGVVTGPGKRKASYGQLAARAAIMDVPKDVPLKALTHFKVIGNVKQKRLDTPAKVRGQAQFGIDVRVPGMLYAAVAMSPVIGGKVASFYDARARAVPGVKAVVQYSRGVAVVAESWWQAKKAKDLLQIHWDGGLNANTDQKSIWDGLLSAAEQPGTVLHEHGDADGAFKQATQTIDALYKLPFVAHATMEPQNTIADVRIDRAIIHAPTQFQQLVPHAVAGATGLKPEQVEVHTPFLGGGSGRRVEVDYVIDAAEISRAVGAPVKMIWSREDDMTHDAYLPASIVKLWAGVDAGGKPMALRMHATSPAVVDNLMSVFIGESIDPLAPGRVDNYPYDTPHMKLTSQAHETGVPSSAWRAVSHGLNAIALECFIDELSSAAGKDAIHFRLDMLENQPAGNRQSRLATEIPSSARMKRVLEEVRSKSGWGRTLPTGRGMGVAVIQACNTVIALVAQVNVSVGLDVAIEKVTAVVDAGILVHPDQALAQIQGAIVVGQSACMWGEITIENGGIEQTNFDSYRVARMSDAPKTLDISFIGSDSAPGGLGEPATAVIQAAIGNAIFAACAKRCRTLPYTPENIKGFT
ncbi:MAG: molybdopterin cofactor-binding domain-containing protein [Betaproteobacteria bacterium]